MLQTGISGAEHVPCKSPRWQVEAAILKVGLPRLQFCFPQPACVGMSLPGTAAQACLDLPNRALPCRCTAGAAAAWSSTPAMTAWC